MAEQFSFDTFLHAVIMQGEHEARAEGVSTVEAHHLLLALAGQQGSPAQEMLSSAGLGHQEIREALDHEFEHSLSAVGVSLAAFDLPRPTVAPSRSPHMGASAKLALERCFASGRKKDMRPEHVLLGILQAQAGTVPRALELAGIDRQELTGQVRRALEETAA